MRGRSSNLPHRPPPQNERAIPSEQKIHDGVYQEFYKNSTGTRINTVEVLVEAVRKQYPELYLSLLQPYVCNLLYYAAASGHATATPIDATNASPENLKYRTYVAPAKRIDSNPGYLADAVEFGKYLYKWRDHEYIVYSTVGGSGPYSDPVTYLLGSTQAANDALILSVCRFMTDIHNAVLVFDGGYWQTSRELWQSVQNSSWDDVILDPGMKKSIVGEVEKFYNSREKYQKLKVPWKRGIIFYGPPGNGKTISIKATMHTLSALPAPIPTLYVRSLSSYAGPESALNTIFTKARQTAPCFLVFEDLDSLVTDAVRSYFLNEVDGLRNNDGILMIGSTNHFERLDPGISKRPSRFDRKYFFGDPGLEDRVLYCRFWRKKLGGDEGVEFPEELVRPIAEITGGFSFAYMQEAFVAALLAIANGDAGEVGGEWGEERGEERRGEQCWCGNCGLGVDPRGCGCLLVLSGDGEKDLGRYILWREIKKVVKELRKELDGVI